MTMCCGNGWLIEAKASLKFESLGMDLADRDGRRAPAAAQRDHAAPWAWPTTDKVVVLR